MYFGLFIALVPLFLGYLIKLKQKKWLIQINHILSWIVYSILFIMGIELSQLDHFTTHLQTILGYTALFFICTFGFNFVVLLFFDKWFPWRTADANEPYTSRLKMILESLRVCIALLAGFMVGLLPLPIWQHTDIIAKSILIVMMVLIGIQLRSSGMTIRQILLNKIGMATTLIVILSAFMGGAIAAWILGIPTKIGLAISSGFGWYSLSGILMTEAHGPVIGSITFLNDILRELCAIIFIPTLIKRHKLTTLGLCGATAMDFTLPMLQKGAGVAIVPPAIVQGFLLTLFMPILMTLFNYY
ncbi:lysine exporter LysO family protein [Orbaceae bacterium ESL0727]|nr:lysine exporter LysO family protein [Orbaceae bacterium ESL0727]